MKKMLAFVVAVVLFKTEFAQQISYDEASISGNMKLGANVVTRFDEQVFEVSDLDKAKLKVHTVYTLLNKEAEEYLEFNLVTDKYTSLGDVEIKLYDASGKEINRFRKKDLIKRAGNQEFVEDNIYHYLVLSTASYPVTVEETYQLNYAGTYIVPSYVVQNIDQGVEQSSLTVRVPKDIGIRFKERNIVLKPSITDDGNNIVYNWTVKNLSAFKYEIGSVNKFDYCPRIDLAPNKFRFFNTQGDMSSWKSLGEWGNKLQEGLDVLPEERKEFYVSLIKDAKTDREKVSILYHYLQDNFRYVSIQLGLGGLRPFPAKFTDEKKYGDCKGLSFYMYSILKSIGIKSYVAWVNAEYNSPPVDPAFPSDRFNHVILCVPQQNDSIWLDCTSKTNEFDVLGSFTENRNALLLTEDGGVLVATPKSKSSFNIMNVVTRIELNEDGSGKTKSMMQSRGDFKDILSDVESSKKEDQKKYIVRYFGFKQPDEFSVTKSGLENKGTEIDLDIEKIPQFTAGNKMFLNPRIYSLISGKLPESDSRKHDFYFQTCFEKTDTTVYHLPEGYVVEVLPKNADNKCAYATYNTSYSFNRETNELTTAARLVLNQNRIPADKFAEVKTFFDQVYSDSMQKLVIKKN